jgi:hypothetical protein
MADLLRAVRYSEVTKVRKILKENPEVDVNWTSPAHDRTTAIHFGCCQGHDKVVSLLLTHPNIDVNLKDGYGRTPFSYGCSLGQDYCVRVLLRDPRVVVDSKDEHGRTTLSMAAASGRLEVIKWWIASGKEIAVTPGDEKTDPIQAAKKYKFPEIKVLLESYKADPRGTRHCVRLELGCFGEVAGGVFALVVFLCENFLRLKAGDCSWTARFFRIAMALPMEMQMILCHRVVESMGATIVGEDCDVAFRMLTQTLRFPED